ncbi:DP-EP family protein [Shewanella sp. OMA3-2]|uniref:DP-EP family protein n=1 Tax=Shewanella sp. OMA3-2 TaxID=2908650 RepID=UPI001F3C2195|nr:DP-EP family protein [Shewanella sp. OMA3-2]UJF21643.1 DP-EP family protein [Shewanella sp. OMA3-2]
MSALNNQETIINVIVTLENNQPIFSYTDENNNPRSGDVVMTENGLISYNLIDKTARGLAFVGAAFSTPFDSVIDQVQVVNNGSTLQLSDSDQVIGNTEFRLILSNSTPGFSSHLLLSPDPEVINRPS